MTTGTTASGSENWETYSDGSEMEPERDVRETIYTRMEAPTPTMNPLGLSQGYNAKRPVTAGAMAPPPAKHHHVQSQQYAQERFRELSDENAHAGVRVEGSDAAWNTELEESY